MRKYILYGLLGIFLVIGLYLKGYNNGVNDTTLKWQKETAERISVIKELEEKYSQQVKKYEAETHRLSDKLYEQELSHAREVASLNASYASRLLQSEQRIEVYKRMSSTKDNSCQNLASHTARLDKQLTEGIDLVRELRELIKLRDSQLRTINEQFKLIENSNNE